MYPSRRYLAKIEACRKHENCPCDGEPAKKKKPPFAGRREEISPLPAVPA